MMDGGAWSRITKLLVLLTKLKKYSSSILMNLNKLYIVTLTTDPSLLDPPLSAILTCDRLHEIEPGLPGVARRLRF